MGISSANVQGTPGQQTANSLNNRTNLLQLQQQQAAEQERIRLAQQQQAMQAGQQIAALGQQRREEQRNAIGQQAQALINTYGGANAYAMNPELLETYARATQVPLSSLTAGTVSPDQQMRFAARFPELSGQGFGGTRDAKPGEERPPAVGTPKPEPQPYQAPQPTPREPAPVPVPMSQPGRTPAPEQEPHTDPQATRTPAPNDSLYTALGRDLLQIQTQIRDGGNHATGIRGAISAYQTADPNSLNPTEQARAELWQTLQRDPADFLRIIGYDQNAGRTQDTQDAMTWAIGLQHETQRTRLATAYRDLVGFNDISDARRVVDEVINRAATATAQQPQGQPSRETIEDRLFLEGLQAIASPHPEPREADGNGSAPPPDTPAEREAARNATPAEAIQIATNPEATPEERLNTATQAFGEDTGREVTNVVEGLQQRDVQRVRRSAARLSAQLKTGVQTTRRHMYQSNGENTVAEDFALLRNTEGAELATHMGRVMTEHPEQFALIYPENAAAQTQAAFDRASTALQQGNAEMANVNAELARFRAERVAAMYLGEHGAELLRSEVEGLIAENDLKGAQAALMGAQATMAGIEVNRAQNQQEAFENGEIPMSADAAVEILKVLPNLMNQVEGESQRELEDAMPELFNAILGTMGMTWQQRQDGNWWNWLGIGSPAQPGQIVSQSEAEFQQGVAGAERPSGQGYNGFSEAGRSLMNDAGIGQR